MKTVGEILIETRHGKNLTLEQVERDTKIRKKILEQLEKGDWNSFAPAYAKGLLRNYVSYLGLDAVKILAFYRREYDEKKQIFKTKKLTAINPKIRITPAVISLFLVGLAILTVTGYLFYQYRSFTASPNLEIFEPKNNEKVKSSLVNVVGTTLDGSILKINGEKVQISPGGTFSIPVNLKQGLNTLTITSANRFGQITTIRRTVILEDKENSKISESQTHDVINLKLQIIDRPTFLTIEIDGKNIFDGLMLPGSEKTFTAKEKIKIVTEDAGATIVTVRNKTWALGDKSQRVEKIYTLGDS